MTTSVDVLAVMARDATAAWNDRRGDREIQEFLGAESNEARDAVAELIEAAEQVSDASVKHYGDCMGLHLSLTGIGGLNERLAAALAHVKGA